MGQRLETKSRNYLWDNIKTLLVFTVVLGHFLETFPLENTIIKGLDFLIYSFHMPAFLFISGFWSKSYCKEGKVRIEKVANFIMYYLIFQILFFIEIKVFFNPEKTFSFLEPNIGLWYLLSMIAFYLFIPLAEKLPAYIFLPATIILGLSIGTNSQAGDFMAISRSFVFAPFFFAGYYTSENAINKLRQLKLRFLMGIGAFVLGIGICYYMIKTYTIDIFPMKLFYGKHGYEAMNFTTLQGIGLRSLAWIVSSLLTIALILLFSEKKNIFSYIGKNSLQIYLLHFIVILFFEMTDFTDAFPIETIWQGAILCLVAAVLTLFLSIPIFTKPFEWIQALVNKMLKLSKNKA